ncbi:MAG: transporter substrate-binding domain-containing protein [Kurthia sp.]|nr:transporter substrate-binding domain-containing protein [Candidatus Kurthia equi]
MKKWLLAMVTVLAMVVLAACGSGSDDSSNSGGKKDTSTVDKVKDTKKLVIGTNAGYYPFEMIDKDGKMVGYDMDVANAIAKELGAKVEVKQFGFDALIPALQSGKIDMIFAGMTITDERAEVVNFANSYYETGQSVMVKSDSKIKDPKELDKKGTTIAVQIATTGAIVSKKEFKNAEIKEFEDFPAAALAAQQGQVDAVVYDEPAIKVYALQNEGKVKALDDLLASDNLGIALSKDDDATLKWVNEFLASYIGSDEEKATRAKWFEESDWLDTVNNPE